MRQEEINKILESHKKWLAKDGGCRAKLIGKNLINLDFSGRDLTWADFRLTNLLFANFKRSNLSNADLTWTNLGDADLSGAKGLLDPIEFMDANFEQVERGYIVYKAFGGTYDPPEEWKIEPGSIITEIVNFNRCSDCGSGINVAPLEWVKSSYPNKQIWRCLIEWSWLVGVCVPYNTNGKIRCSKLRLLEIVE